jgi:hypothetical protein
MRPWVQPSAPKEKEKAKKKKHKAPRLEQKQ